MSINQLGDKTTGHSLGLAYLSDVASVIPPSGLAIPTSQSQWIGTGISGTYQYTYTGVSPLLTSTSVISAALQNPLNTNSINDALSAWLVTAIPSAANGGSITFVVAAQPSIYNTMVIAWAVVKF